MAGGPCGRTNGVACRPGEAEIRTQRQKDQREDLLEGLGEQASQDVHARQQDRDVHAQWQDWDVHARQQDRDFHARWQDRDVHARWQDQDEDPPQCLSGALAAKAVLDHQEEGGP